jgi:hypothetical protein
MFGKLTGLVRRQLGSLVMGLSLQSCCPDGDDEVGTKRSLLALATSPYLDLASVSNFFEQIPTRKKNIPRQQASQQYCNNIRASQRKEPCHIKPAPPVTIGP